MLDVGWQELALTGVVALVVLGPKELPGLMRMAGQMVRRARMVAHEFRMSMEDLAAEAELDEVRRKAEKLAAEKEPLIADPEKMGQQEDSGTKTGMASETQAEPGAGAQP